MSDDHAALEATWLRIRPLYCTLNLEQAMAWPAMAIVIRTAARAFQPGRQCVDHPALRAMAHTYAEQAEQAEIPPDIARRCRRGQKRRHAAPQPEPDLFKEPA